MKNPLPEIIRELETFAVLQIKLDGVDVTVNIDKTPPVVTLDPGDGQSISLSHSLLLVNYSDPSSTLTSPPSTLPSGIDLSALQVKLDGVDVTANFYKYPAGAASDGVDIPAGQHTWNVRVADRAGNVASNMVTFTVTVS